jgi:hypothetical protein
MKIIKYIPTVVISLSVLLLLIGLIRGIAGNPSEANLNNPIWSDSGPFELSPERGRFALTYSLIENHSFFFTTPIANFAAPDLGFKNGHYVSMFAPAVSYLVMPGYVLGKFFGLSQLGAFSIIALFSLLNFLLVRAISLRLGARGNASTLAAFIYLFATPAIAYAGNMYQHQISTFLILGALYTLLRWSNLSSLCLVWFLCASSIPVDYPNLILMFPIGLFALGKYISVKQLSNKLTLNFRPTILLTFLSMLLPLLFFLWFNYRSYGNPLQFSGTVPSANLQNAGIVIQSGSVSLKPAPETLLQSELTKKSAIGFFKTRNILNGLYIHLLSPDRGVITFTPIVLLGIVGAYILYRQKHHILPTLLGIIGSNLILYSMWGDPWGGWAFGSRYLIPSYAILAILLAVAISKLKSHLLFLIPFVVLLTYSTSVNILGAVTSNRIPPQVEILALEKMTGKRERYSFDRNWELLTSGNSRSFIYQVLLKESLSTVDYYRLLVVLALISEISLLVLSIRHD